MQPPSSAALFRVLNSRCLAVLAVFWLAAVTGCAVSHDALLLRGDTRVRLRSASAAGYEPVTDARVRVHFSGQVNDRVAVKGRVSAMAADPTEPRLDRAQLTFRPAGLRGTVLEVGRLGDLEGRASTHGEHLFEGNANHDGWRISHRRDVSGSAYSWGLRLSDRSVSYRDARARVRSVGGDVAVDLGAGGRARVALDLHSARTVASPNQTLLELRASWHGRLASQPLKLGVQSIQSSVAGRSPRTAWVAGATWGDIRRADADWQLGYQWSRVEQDSVLTGLTQDDLPFRDNYSSHGLRIDRKLGASTVLQLHGGFASRRSETGSATVFGVVVEHRF